MKTLILIALFSASVCSSSEVENYIKLRVGSKELDRESILKGLKRARVSVLVADGTVDSAFLNRVALDLVGKEKAIEVAPSKDTTEAEIVIFCQTINGNAVVDIGINEWCVVVRGSSLYKYNTTSWRKWSKKEGATPTIFAEEMKSLLLELMSAIKIANVVK